MAGHCDEEGCDRDSPGRHKCTMHYLRDLRARKRSGGVIAPHNRRPGSFDRVLEESWARDDAWRRGGSDQAVKTAYLNSLSIRETGIYCKGVLSRASIAGTPAEIRSWQKLIRQIAQLN